MNRAHLFLVRSLGEAPSRLPPQDGPEWLYAVSAKPESERRTAPTQNEKLLRAHRIAAEVRERRGMGVRFKSCRMAEWTAD